MLFPKHILRRPPRSIIQKNSALLQGSLPDGKIGAKLGRLYSRLEYPTPTPHSRTLLLVGLVPPGKI